MSKVCLDSSDSSHIEHACRISATSKLPLLDREFDTMLLEAIDEGLSKLGDSAKQAIYLHIEKNFNIEKQEIPHKIDSFARAIEKIFGPSAKLLEIEIMKKLHEKVRDCVVCLPERSNLEFTDYVKSIRTSDH